MRSGDVVLMQRGDHLVAKRIGELEDSGGAGISGEEMVDSGADSQDVSGQNARQQWLGKIVRVRRKKEKIELGAKKTPAETLASVVLRPARWVKEKVFDTEEADREAEEIKR
jgi:hypothetical protein